MACLKKLSNNIAFDCADLSLTPAGVMRIEEALILNSSDISSIAVANGVATITMNSGRKGFVVNSINNSVIYQDAIKTNDLTPSFEDHTVIIKALTNALDGTTYRGMIQQLLQGNFRVVFKTADNRFYVAGTYAGLEASDLATDSSTDGISTVTLKTPDTASGDLLAAVTSANYTALKTAAA